MILQSLVKLYEILQGEGRVSELGWESVDISYRILLNTEGNLLGIIKLDDTENYRKFEGELVLWRIVPGNRQRSGKNPIAYFLCDSPIYLLGLSAKGSEKQSENRLNQEKAQDYFNRSKGLHHQILDGCKVNEAKAVLKFFDLWDVNKVKENPIIQKNLPDLYKAKNMIFSVDGKDVHTVPEIKTAWDNFIKEKNIKNKDHLGCCLVTGKEKQIIGRLHPVIKKVIGSHPKGALLVSFDKRSFESYGHDEGQGLNAPVSEYAAFAYGTALNCLLDDKKHVRMIGGTTIVYWAEKAKSAYQDIFNIFLSGEKESGRVSDQDLKGIITNILRGMPADLENVVIDPQEPFYILGLSPNAARLSVRFFLRNNFGKILKCINKHQEQMSICKADWEKEIIPLKWILKETANSHSIDSAVSPLLAGALFRSIFTDSLYPAAVFQNIMLRIFADRDEVTSKGTMIKKINYVKAAFIKAYLLRNHKQRWEEKLTMSVNENCNEIPYVLGRLFSVLESVQSKANPGIKATIKDRYFNSACATPSSIYPILIKLSNAHLGKIEGGLQIYYSKKIQELLSKIAMPNHGTPLPNRLTLEEQGAFILGYYQETQARFTSKEEQ